VDRTKQKPKRVSKTYEFTVAVEKFVQIKKQHWKTGDRQTLIHRPNQIYEFSRSPAKFVTFQQTTQDKPHDTLPTTTNTTQKGMPQKVRLPTAKQTIRTKTSNHRNQFDPSYSLPLTKLQITTMTTATYQTIRASCKSDAKPMPRRYSSNSHCFFLGGVLRFHFGRWVRRMGPSQTTAPASGPRSTRRLFRGTGVGSTRHGRFTTTMAKGNKTYKRVNKCVLLFTLSKL